MQTSTKNILIIIASFGIYYVIGDLFFKPVRTWFLDFTNQLGMSHILTYAIMGIPLFIGTFLIAGSGKVLENLGLNKSLPKALLFALICTLPMFLGFSVLFEVNPDISLNSILIGVVAAGFFEELYFRGFLFGLAFRKTTLGFIFSVLFGALYFGVLHLYQSSELSELVGIFLITFLGAILFAWVYAEWNFNIWVPVSLHMFMNFAWELFDVSDNALGGIYSNIFRVMTITLIIVLTLIYKKRNRLLLSIHKKTLLMQKGERAPSLK